MLLVYLEVINKIFKWLRCLPENQCSYYDHISGNCHNMSLILEDFESSIAVYQQYNEEEKFSGSSDISRSMSSA